MDKIRKTFKNGDPGDTFDTLKWDFNESRGYNIIYIDGYPYKVSNKFSTIKQKDAATKLYRLRNIIDNICTNLSTERNNFPHMENKIDTFLDIHMEKEWDLQNGKNIVSRYLLSQIPPKCDFMGLNKPKGRYISDEPPIGKDKNLRSTYRDIFMNIDGPLKSTIELLIHELSHTMANHQRWRNDDHGKDFKEAENLITKMFLKIKSI